MRACTGILAAAALLSVGGASYGQALGTASNFNVFIFGNDTETNTDSEGAVAVGGTANFQNYSVASQLSNSFVGNGLVVGNNLTYTNGQVSQGNIAVGGTANLSGVGVPHGTVSTGVDPINFASTESILKNDSSSWGNLTGATGTANSGGVVLDSTASSFDVFNLTSNQLEDANFQGLTIDGNKNETILVNVSGNAADLHDFQFNVNGTDADHILFNFTDAKTLTISGASIIGSILAPYANVEFDNAHINGTLIGDSLNGTAEAHNYQFTGTIPAPVPEAGTTVLMGVMMAGLFVILYKRRNAKQAE